MGKTRETRACSGTSRLSRFRNSGTRHALELERTPLSINPAKTSAVYVGPSHDTHRRQDARPESVNLIGKLIELLGDCDDTVVHCRRAAPRTLKLIVPSKPCTSGVNWADT